jgi:hypothetical protein
MSYKLELTEQDLQVLNMGIGEIAFKLAAPLVEKLNKQIAEQQKINDEK